MVTTVLPFLYVCVYVGGASFLVYKIKVAAAFNRNNIFFFVIQNQTWHSQLYPSLLALVQAVLVDACNQLKITLKPAHVPPECLFVIAPTQPNLTLHIFNIGNL